MYWLGNPPIWPASLVSKHPFDFNSRGPCQTCRLDPCVITRKDGKRLFPTTCPGCPWMPMDAGMLMDAGQKAFWPLLICGSILEKRSYQKAVTI